MMITRKSIFINSKRTQMVHEYQLEVDWILIFAKKAKKLKVLYREIIG